MAASILFELNNMSCTKLITAYLEETNGLKIIDYTKVHIKSERSDL